MLADIPTVITTEIVNELTSITFTLPPKDYTAGDALDLTGMSVIAHYSHVSDRDVTSVATISPAGGSPLAVGNNTITASYTEKGIIKTVSVVVNAKPAVASWANGSRDDISEVLAKHKTGEINLYETPGWEIGSTRTIPLSAMPATGVGESHVAQDVEFVLMDKNVVDLAAGGKCNFVIGMKNCLANGATTENGYMNSDITNAGGWKNSARRTWCNNVFTNAVPTGLKNLVKPASIKTSAGNKSTTINPTTDRWFLPCVYNVFGAISGSVSGEDTVQWEWYKTSANRIKKAGTSEYITWWWERSPNSGDIGAFCIVNSAGNTGSNSSNSRGGLVPHACI